MSWNGTVRCSHCYGTGHNKRGCPDIKRSIKNNPDGWYAQQARERKKTPRKCGWCGETGHNTRTCVNRIGSEDKLAELQPLLAEHVGHVLSLVGLGRGAVVRKEDHNGKPLIGVVLGAYLRTGKLWKPDSVTQHNEPSINVRWHNGESDSLWIPNGVFKSKESTLTKVFGFKTAHQTKSWGYNYTKLLSESNEDLVVETSCVLQEGQRVKDIEEWITALTESVKKCEDYKKSVKNP